MTTIDPRYHVKTVIADANRTENDYHAMSGWSPNITLGQQYTFNFSESLNLARAIQKRGWFQDPMLPNSPPMDLRGELLKGIHELQKPETARRQAKGSVKLTRGGAWLLNLYARYIGVAERFQSGQPRPIHPLG